MFDGSFKLEGAFKYVEYFISTRHCIKYENFLTNKIEKY